MSGLRKEDFTVYDDGVRQEVTYFSNDRVPVSLGILLDISGSMTSDKIATARGRDRPVHLRPARRRTTSCSSWSLRAIRASRSSGRATASLISRAVERVKPVGRNRDVRRRRRRPAAGQRR